MPRTSSALGSADLVVIGAGIAGLAHAAAAVRIGLSVIVVDKSTVSSGASNRGTGHLGFTAAPADQRLLSERSRELWLDLAERSGCWIREHGATVVARSRDEQDVLDELAQERGARNVVALGRVAVLERTPVRDPALVGGVWLPRDLQIDPRTALPTIAAWLAAAGVTFLWRTPVHAVEPGLVHTVRGSINAETIVVAVDHEVDSIAGLGSTGPATPTDAASAPDGSLDLAGLRSSVVTSDLVAARSPWAGGLETPVQTAWALAQSPGVEQLASARVLHRRMSAEFPELAVLGMRQAHAQLPDGTLLLGATRLAGDGSVFHNAIVSELVVDQALTLFGIRSLRVTERWQGTTTAAIAPSLHSPAEGIRVVRLPVDAGMALAPAVAEQVVGSLRRVLPSRS